MPEFELNGGAEKAFRDLDYIARGYIEALFFTIDEEMADKGFLDLAPETLAQIVDDCAKFEEVICGTYYS